MSYDFFLPCTPEKATPVSIYEDGEIVFHDTSVIEEVETALAAIELGFEMPEEVSLCTEAFFMWRDNPRRFICASNLFPVMTIGYVSCAWADAAVNRTTIARLIQTRVDTKHLTIVFSLPKKRSNSH